MANDQKAATDFESRADAFLDELEIPVEQRAELKQQPELLEKGMNLSRGCKKALDFLNKEHPASQTSQPS